MYDEGIESCFTKIRSQSESYERALDTNHPLLSTASCDIVSPALAVASLLCVCIDAA